MNSISPLKADRLIRVFDVIADFTTEVPLDAISWTKRKALSHIEEESEKSDIAGSSMGSPGFRKFVKRFHVDDPLG